MCVWEETGRERKSERKKERKKERKRERGRGERKRGREGGRERARARESQRERRGGSVCTCRIGGVGNLHHGDAVARAVLCWEGHDTEADDVRPVIVEVDDYHRVYPVLVE